MIHPREIRAVFFASVSYILISLEKRGKPNMPERLVVFTEREGGPVCGLDEELIRKNGGSVRYGRAADEKERIRIAARAEVVVVGGARLSREFLAALPDLKGIARLGI